MTRTRVQAIVIQNDRVLFGYGKGYHFFPGGGLEDGETPEQGALRELKEEANVDGDILLRFNRDVFPHTQTFLVDIGEQVPSLGFDPEETDKGDQISLAGIELIALDRTGSFTSIDIDYFRLLSAECQKHEVVFPWLGKMDTLITGWRQR